jgi:hypothetical protein
MIDDMGVTGAEMLEAAGAKNVRPFAHRDREPGRGIHEVGVARMAKTRANPSSTPSSRRTTYGTCS